MATLIRGDKRKVAAQLKAEITRNAGNQQLQELLDVVLSPQTSLEETENLDWCRALIAGGNSFDEFAKTVRAYDNATTCGLVWTSNFVAYRCRTCGISPCMSICADCFHGGNHEDHDFNMFRSQAGGACDCGDPSVMRTAGFCHLHGPDKPKNHTVPSDLLPMADVVVPRLVFRFVLYLRDLFFKCSDLPKMRFDLKGGEPLLGLLHELCNMGGAMRTVMTRALTDPMLYQNHTDGSAGCYCHLKPHIQQTQEILQNAQGSLVFPEIPEVLRGNPAVAYPLVPSSFVEELLFWAVIFEFPEKIVTLLLKMLPDNTYKELFTKSFVKFYGCIAMSLAISEHPDRLSSRVVHISVQLFSNEDLAIQMTNDLQLIHILIASLQCLLKRTLVDNHIKGAPTCPSGQKNCQVADCEHPVMKHHCYWPVISDLTNILSHRSVVHQFFTDPALLKMWTNVLSMFMCMNLNERELHNHVEFEPNAYSTAFSAEIEACAAPMWQLYTHCKDETTAHYTQALLNACVENTNDWLQEANIQESFDPYQVSFHIPLLRYYALMLSQALTKQGVKITPEEEFLKNLIIFPLQIQAMVSEVFCGMWVRNGLQIKRQAMTYMQCHFCASMIDLDLFLLQVGAVYLDPDFFVTKVFSCFKVLETLTFNQSHSNSQLDPENEPAMLEGALYLLATLLSTRTHMGASEEELLRQEMVALLCIQDRPHSQLADQIPEKTGLFNSNEHFESILAEVADYHDPMSETGSGGLQQGRYSPKPHIWETEFDPIHVMLRVMQKKDFQTAMDRYSSHMKQTGRHSGSSDLWPPFQPLKLPTTAFQNLHQLLHCKTLHGAIFIILYKAVHGKSITDPVLYLCIALLDMMLQYPTVRIVSKTPTPDVIRDGDFAAMFPDNLILNNIIHRIKTVEIPSLHEKPSTSHQRTMDSTDLLLQQLLNEEVSIYSQNLFGLAVGWEGHHNLEEAEAHMEEEEVYASEEEQDYVEEELDGMEQDEVDDIEEETDGMEVAEVGGDVEADTEQGDDVDTQSASLQTADEPTEALQDLSATTSTATSSSKKSSRVQTVLWTPCKMLTINESMLDLLVKLHSKMVGKEGSYLPPSMRTEKGEKNDQGVQVGGGAFYVKRLLDKICHLQPESQKQIEELCQLKDQPDNGQTESNAQSSADRRKKAREVQQKLFAKLAAEQRKFLEKSLETEESLAEVPEAEDDRETATSKEADAREMFECVICGQTAPSTGDNPIGMVALMQATGVLGHRSQVSEAQTLPTQSGEELTHAGRYRNVNLRRKEDLMGNFNKESLLMSVDTEWNGVHIQSCRHYIHLSCHQSYLNSLQEYQSNHHHVHSRGEYECPLCRQLANFVLPCMPSVQDPTTNKPHGVERNYSCIVAEVMDRLLNRRERPGSLGGILTATENIFMQRLQLENRFNTHGSGLMRRALPLMEIRQILLQSTARVNLELDLVVRGNLLTAQSSSQPTAKRTCLGTLLEVLSFIQSDEMYIAMASKAWSSLTGVEPGTQPLVPRAQSNDVPTLLRDPISLLLYLITVMRHPVHKDYFTCVVRALYAMLYTQALSVISCRMPQTERKAWTESGKSCQDNSTQIQMESLLSEIITMYSQSRLYVDVDTHQGLAICQSVWTPQCVETAIQQYCLPFLRIAALIQHHLYREELPTCQRQDVEFEVLVNFLNLCTPPSVDEKQPNLYSARCLHFVGDNPSELLRVWCQEFLVFVSKNHPVAKRLLLHNPIFYPPRLLQLPTRYDDVFQYYRQRRCDRCKSMPSRPVVCLVCGALICLNVAGLGCHLSGIRAPMEAEHSLACGSGTAVYLDINSSTVIIIRGERLCYWASVYLDRHGEEDRELKRGKPLVLCPQRYKMLEHLWRSHGFNHCCKNWLLHGGHGSHHF